MVNHYLCSVWDDCHSETAVFLTTAGNIYCNRMYSDSKICIKDQVNTDWGNIGSTLKCPERKKSFLMLIK